MPKLWAWDGTWAVSSSWIPQQEVIFRDAGRRFVVRAAPSDHLSVTVQSPDNMANTNLAVLLRAKDDLTLVEIPIPEPKRGEVQIAVESCGICGSDISLWKKGELTGFNVTEPLGLGHEPSGTITKLGEGVSRFHVGDRVAIEPREPCRVCDFCMAGHYNMCPQDQANIQGRPGILARYVVHPQDSCHKLPDHVTFEQGALLEPLSVAVHACKRAGVTIGEKVLVCGAGAIGLLNMMTARAMGASQICMTDVSAKRLDVAKKLGAHHTVLVDSSEPQSLAKKVEETLSAMPDITIECSGAQHSIATGIYATKSRGTLMLIGSGAPLLTLPIVHAAVREITIMGNFAYANDYPTAIDLVSSGAVDVKPLITHRFPLEESLEAFRISSTGDDGAIKVLVKCGKQ